MDRVLTMAKKNFLPGSHEQLAREREERETPTTSTDWYTPEMKARMEASRRQNLKPKFEALFTIFSDQSGRLLFVKHNDDPIRIGIDQEAGIVPPMAIATTDEHWELIGESVCYQGMRHVNGSSRAGRLFDAAQRDLARLPRNRKSVKENEAA